jgi:glutamate-1-semialdehyde 2,1-aminomutase
MYHIAPTGSVYQAGTLSGNPLAMAAGLAMIDLLSQSGVYEELERKSEKLCQGLKDNVESLGIAAQFTRVGSMFSMFFTKHQIVDFESVKTCDTQFFSRYFTALLDRGVYIAPSQYEAGFMSMAHTDDDIEKTIEISREALKIAKAK